MCEREALSITDYYKLAAEGLPAMQDLFARFCRTLAEEENIRELHRKNTIAIASRQRVVTLLNDPNVISALGTAAAIAKLEPGQGFEAVVHSQFDGHAVSDILNSVFGPYSQLNVDSPIREEVHSLFLFIHTYHEQYERSMVGNR